MRCRPHFGLSERYPLTAEGPTGTVYWGGRFGHHAGMRQVLFLCTGNYYRSRYAEELFNHAAKALQLPWRAFSRGVAERGSPDNVGPISPHALDALASRGIAPEGATRHPIPCAPTDFDAAGLAIALKDAEHRPLIERRFPEFADRVTYWHVDDIEFMLPSKALAIIDDRVRELISTLLPQAARQSSPHLHGDPEIG